MMYPMKITKTVLLSFFLASAVSAQEGQLEEMGFVHNDVLRLYQLYVPAEYDDNEAWPLVINLHGATSNPGGQIFVSGMNAVADTARFLVVYPWGLLNQYGDSGWNDHLFAGLLDDVDFISSMIDSIGGNYNIDASRVYAAGLSNGGGMSFTLGCELSSRIAALASVAGPSILSATDDCNPGRAVPLLYTHGTADLLVPFEGGEGIFIPFDFPSSRESVQFWVDHNGCIGDPEIIEIPDIETADSSTVVLEHYTNCEGAAEVAYYIIENGGHTWSDGPPAPPGLEAFFGNVNRDINASAEIWKFFNRFTHPDPDPLGVDIVEGGQLPTEIILEQNYPNPFKGQTRIRYMLDKPGHVALSIYDVLGREVALLVDIYQAIGQHEVVFDSFSLPDGLYLYSLNQAGQIKTRKMTIMK